MRHEDYQYSAMSNIAEALKKGLYPYPLMVEIHPTSICNHRCDYCFHSSVAGNSYFVLKDHRLSLEQYCRLFEEMRRLGVTQLSVSGGGEPLLDERIVDILKAAYDQGLAVRVVTNGNFLSDAIMKELVRADEVRFTVDAIKPTTYSAIKRVPGYLLSRTLDNISNLISLKKEKSSSVSIGVTFLMHPKNHLEAEEFCRCMLDMGVDAVLVKHDICGIVNVPKAEIDHAEARIKRIRDSRLEIRDRISTNMSGKRCFMPYFKVALNQSGQLFSCCLGSQSGEKGGYLLGYLSDKTFKDCWIFCRPLVEGLAHGVGCIACNYTDYRINRIMTKLVYGQFS